MSKGWRVTWIVLAVVVVGLWIVNYYTSNPLAKHRAAIELETYLNKNYPKEALEVQDGKYERKRDMYEFTVKNRDDAKQKYTFQIQNGRGYEVLSDTLKEQSYDPQQSKEVSVQMSNELQQTLATKVQNVKHVSATIRTKKETIQLSSKEEQLEEPAVIAIDIDMTGMSREDLYQIAREVYEELAREQVHYEKVTIAGYELKGEVNQKKWHYIYKIQFMENQPPVKEGITHTI